MKRYTNKELKNLTCEERKKLIADALTEQECLGQQIRDILAGNKDSKQKQKSKEEK